METILNENTMSLSYDWIEEATIGFQGDLTFNFELNRLIQLLKAEMECQATKGTLENPTPSESTHRPKLHLGYDIDTQPTLGFHGPSENPQAYYGKVDIAERHSASETSVSDRPSCAVCKKNFVTKNILRRHVKEIHLREKVKCRECPAAYTRIGQLSDHYRRAHPKVEFKVPRRRRARYSR
jgi:hypothetical protein